MRIWIDTEFNGYKGDLISIALVAENGAAWYQSLACDKPEPWVAQHVMPVVNNAPVTREVMQAQLEAFLAPYAHVHLVADWPDDISHFCQLLITGPGTRLNTPTLTMEVRRDLDAVSDVPHNALHDAIAMRKVHLSQAKPIKQDYFDSDIATAHCGVEVLPDGTITNAAYLLVRDQPLWPDESGEHPDEGFIHVALTREDVQEMLTWLNADWEETAQICGNPNAGHSANAADRQQQGKAEPVAAMREAITETLEFLEERYGNTTGDDWNDADAAAVGDMLQKALVP